jgi:hypothetical protein
MAVFSGNLSLRAGQFALQHLIVCECESHTNSLTHLIIMSLTLTAVFPAISQCLPTNNWNTEGNFLVALIVWMWNVDHTQTVITSCIFPFYDRHLHTNSHGGFRRQTLSACRPQSTHRVATAFWHTFQHDGKISSGLVSGGVNAHPLSLYLPSRKSCSVRSSWEGRYNYPISSLPLYVLCGADQSAH